MNDPIRLFLCGDVMTGRGVDQILPHPSLPHIFEPYVTDSRIYVGLAERAHGAVPKPVPYDYIWGDAAEVLQRMGPDLRIANLETAVTTSEDYWKGKWINYRMHPANIPCLTLPSIDVCTLANNHVLDWGYPGLTETLSVLREAGVVTAGAGRDAAEAAAPAIVPVAGKGRVLVFSFGFPSSGVLPEWVAGGQRAGVNLLPDPSAADIVTIAAQVRAAKREGDVVLASLHWGSNWDFTIGAAEREFAHRLVDEAGVDVVHGHSSHHVKGIEVHGEKLILYGCGDFINDYEGIRGHEAYRGDLSLMYFVDLSPTDGRVQRLEMVPTTMKRLSVRRTSPDGTRWLRETLDREGKKLGTWVEPGEEGTLLLRWPGSL